MVAISLSAIATMRSLTQLELRLSCKHYPSSDTPVPPHLRIFPGPADFLLGLCALGSLPSPPPSKARGLRYAHRAYGIDRGTTTGSAPPPPPLAALARSYRALRVVDGAQAPGNLAVLVEKESIGARVDTRRRAFPHEKDVARRRGTRMRVLLDARTVLLLTPQDTSRLMVQKEIRPIFLSDKNASKSDASSSEKRSLENLF